MQSLDEGRRRRKELLLKTYGPRPQDGYQDWQIYTVDLVDDGAPFEAAETYAKQRMALEANLKKQLFPELPAGSDLDDEQFEEVWRAADSTLPDPFRGSGI